MLIPYNLDNLDKFSPTVIFRSTLSFSLLDFSLFPYIRTHKLFISVKFFKIQFIESLRSPPFIKK